MIITNVSNISRDIYQQYHSGFVVPEIIIPKDDITDNIDDTDTAHRRYSIQYDIVDIDG